MLKKAGIGQFLAVKVAVLTALFCTGGYVVANEQEEYVPADTHFYLGTGRRMPVDHLLALLPKFELPKSSEGAEAIGTIMEIFENPAERMAEWGIDSDLQMSVYTVGIFPVARLALKDAGKFDAALDALEKEHGIKSRNVQDKDVTSRFYSMEELAKIGEKVDAAIENTTEGNADTKSGSADNSRASLLVANDGTDLIVSFLPDGEDTALVNSITGVTPPARSIVASGELKQLRKQWDYGDEMVSYVDFEQIAATITDTESDASKQLTQLLKDDSQAQQGLAMMRSEPCRAEVSALAASWPMVVSGARKFDVTEKEVAYQSHMAVVVKHELLRDTLMLLRGMVPTSQSSSQAMVSVGLGISVDRLAQFVGQFSQLTESLNYKCTALAGMNDLGKTDLSAASLGVVMFGGLARGVRGLSFNLFDVDVDSKDPNAPVESVDTAIAISAADPALLVQTLKMMPQLGILAELPLDGSELLLNPLLPLPIPAGIQVKAAIKGENIVIYSGENGTDYANRLDGNDTEGLFQARVDTRQILTKARTVLEMAGQSPETMTNTLTFMEAYPKGDLSYEVDFTEEGIELNVGGTFDTPDK